MERDTEKWVSLEEIAEHMGLSKDTIRNYIKTTDAILQNRQTV